LSSLSGYEKGSEMKRKTMRFVRRRKWVRAHRLIGLTQDPEPTFPGGSQKGGQFSTPVKGSNSPRRASKVHTVVDHEVADVDDEEEDGNEEEDDDDDDDDDDDENDTGSRLHQSTPLKGSKPRPSGVGGGDTGQYRLKQYKRDKNVVLGLCKERSSCMSSSIIVPWEQVTSVELITPSVLSVTLEVQRYFGEEDGQQVFRPADVEIFITGCPAITLKSLLEERIKFSNIRSEMKAILSSGNVTGIPTLKSTTPRRKTRTASAAVSPRSKIRLTYSGEQEGGDDGIEEFDIDDDDEGEEDEDGNPLDDDGAEEEEEEQDISRAAAAAAFLDNEALQLEDRALELEKIFTLGDCTDHTVLDEREVIVRRAFRLRAYIGALYGARLDGPHQFGDSAVRHIMIKDFDTATQIDMGDDVATANNKMEFLLDKAEARLRDTALCGWGKTNNRLERCMEILVNGFYVELVGLLAQFFKGQATMRSIQGLQSKMQLITSYMRHDDRLALMLESALRPFDLCVQPRPLLSLLLNLDTLLAWYSAVLHQEMKACVDSVVNIWKDVTKDAGGLASKYRYPLPWNPMRSAGESGQFQSLLPEDSTAYLLQYIALTRLHEKNIASSFAKHVNKLDANVHLSFASAYKHLADVYADALKVRTI
jgi:hypothetical protein